MSVKFKDIYNKIINIDKNYLIILFVCILVLSPLLLGMFYSGHDLGFHVTNIDGLITNMSDNLFNYDKLVFNDLYPHGYGSLIFYPNLFYYITALICIVFNMSILSSLKVVAFIIFFFSGFNMYHLVKKIYNDKNCAIIASVLYISATYFIDVFYIRSAYAEIMVFVFMPLVLLGLYKLMNENKKSLFIIGCVGLIHSHLVMTLYFAFACLIICIFNYKKVINKQFIISFIKSAAIIILLSLSYLLPMLESKLSCDYALFKPGHMFNPDIICFKGLLLKNYILYHNSISIGYTLPFIGIVLFILSILRYKDNIKDIIERKYFLSFISIFFISLVMTSMLFPWSKMPAIFQFIQFPFRLASFVVLTFSIVASLAIKNSSIKAKRCVLALILVLLLVRLDLYLLPSDKVVIIDELKMPDIFRLGWQREYLPVTTHTDLDYFFDRKLDSIIIDGNINIIEETNNNLDYSAIIENSNNAIIEIPRVYYIGYTIRYITSDKTYNLDYYENGKGFIEIKLPNEDGEIIVEYTGTTISNISFYITSITLVSLVIYMLFRKYRVFKKN